MRFRIGGGNHAVCARVKLAAREIRDDGARGAAQRDAGGPVNTVAKVSSGDVRRLLPGRHPCESQRGRDTSWAEPMAKGLVEQHARSGVIGAVAVEVQ